MNMKYWKPSEIESPYSGEGNLPAIELSGGQEVIGLAVRPTGQIMFIELCDEWKTINLSAEDAIIALQEAIEWVKRNAKPGEGS